MSKVTIYSAEYKNADELIYKLSLKNKVEASKKLCEFYANARFKIDNENFQRQYTDGSDDGGIDFYHNEDGTFFIFQTKFSSKSKNTSASEILDEIRKIKNTLTANNPNKKAADFIYSLKRESRNTEATLEILWLTTNIIKQSVRDEIQKNLELWRKENGWELGIDFFVIDKNTLESVIYDVKHGYIPYTGKKELILDKEQWIETTWEETGVYSVVCSVNINDILEWFHDSYDIDKFLQKNVREFIGESSKINKAICKSYTESAPWFWYKHNGIIIFVDNLSINKSTKKLVLRNPQVVNGGQTLKALFSPYNKNQKKNNSAKVILRIYRLPYENTETYKRTIDIISALNTQNKITPSDLKSTDPRQVRLELLFNNIGSSYKYLRKRAKETRCSRSAISMKNLALRYYVCKRNIPHDGVTGQVEELFEDDSKYNEIFNETAINQDISGNHVIINYVTCWNIDQILQRKVELSAKDKEFFRYTKWYVLVDIYKKLADWKQKKFTLSWQMWNDFIESYLFAKAVVDYSRIAFRIGREILPKQAEPRSFFTNKDTVKKFTSKVSKRNFEMHINKAFRRFQKENM